MGNPERRFRGFKVLDLKVRKSKRLKVTVSRLDAIALFGFTQGLLKLDA